MTDVVLEEVRAWQGGALEPIYLRQGASAKPGAVQTLPIKDETGLCPQRNSDIIRMTDSP